MRFRMTSDSSWESRLDRVVDVLVDKEHFFLDKNYGSEIETIVVVAMCRRPERDFKQRVRFMRAEKTFYTDVMVDFNVMINADMMARMTHVIDQMLVQLSETLKKRKFTDFNTDVFLQDLRSWLADVVADYDGHTSGAWQY